MPILSPRNVLLNIVLASSVRRRSTQFHYGVGHTYHLMASSLSRWSSRTSSSLTHWAWKMISQKCSLNGTNHQIYTRSGPVFLKAFWSRILSSSTMIIGKQSFLRWCLAWQFQIQELLSIASGLSHPDLQLLIMAMEEWFHEILSFDLKR